MQVNPMFAKYSCALHLLDTFRAFRRKAYEGELESRDAVESLPLSLRPKLYCFEGMYRGCRSSLAGRTELQWRTGSDYGVFEALVLELMDGLGERNALVRALLDGPAPENPFLARVILEKRIKELLSQFCREAKDGGNPDVLKGDPDKYACKFVSLIEQTSPKARAPLFGAIQCCYGQVSKQHELRVLPSLLHRSPHSLRQWVEQTEALWAHIKAQALCILLNQDSWPKPIDHERELVRRIHARLEHLRISLPVEELMLLSHRPDIKECIIRQWIGQP